MSTGEEVSVMAMTSDPKVGQSKAGAKPAVKNKPAKEKKPRDTKAPKEKKPKSSSPSHPSYFQMVKEAIVALKEKSGSSPYAIAKHMEEKHKNVLPANYKKMLTLQLRNCLAKGKLVKVKGSFKLSEVGKKESVKKPLVVAKKPLAVVKKPKSVSSGPAKAKKTVVAASKKKKAGEKRKKSVAAASKPKTKPAAKSRQLKSIKSPAAKAKKAAAPRPKQPKSIKSPAAKKARRAAA